MFHIINYKLAIDFPLISHTIYFMSLADESTKMDISAGRVSSSSSSSDSSSSSSTDSTSSDSSDSEAG